MRKTKIIVNRIEKANRILMDFPALMGNGFAQFIENYKSDFIQNKKKIVITKTVHCNLMKLVNSTNQVEANKARNVLDTINDNQGIFFVEDSNADINEQEFDVKTDLISDLTLHITTDIQLFISNDCGLAKDAVKLNYMKCVSAKNLYVCYISDSGCLFSSVFETKQQKKIKSQTIIPNEKQKPSIIENDHSITNNKEIEDEKGWRFDWKSGLITLFGCVATSVAAYGVYKGLNN